MHQHEHCRARYPCLYWATSSSDGLGARFCSFTFQQQHQLTWQCWHSCQSSPSIAFVTYNQESTACDSVNFLIASVFLSKIGVSANQLTFGPRCNIEEAWFKPWCLKWLAAKAFALQESAMRKVAPANRGAWQIQKELQEVYDQIG